jgi:sugar/nucleoside kinase (ribokinase family)
MNDRIIVVGDVILDETVELVPIGQSAEGQVSYTELRRTVQCGGAANVVKHLARLGATVCLVHGGEMLSFQHDGLTTSELLRIVQMSGRGEHVRKLRYYCGPDKLLKVNYPGRPDILYDRLRDTLEGFPCSAIVACDNGCANIRGQQELIVNLAHRRAKRLTVDAQLSLSAPDFLAWCGADEIMLNRDELLAIGYEAVRDNFGRHHVKLGARGSAYWDGTQNQRHDGYQVYAVDTVGAGDAYLAAWLRTGHLGAANLWAAISCTKIGTGLPIREDLDAYDDEAATRLRECL